MSTRWRAAAGALAVCLLAACGSGDHDTAPPPLLSAAPSHSATPTGAPTSSAATAVPCSTASAVAGWPLRRRASSLVVVPVLNFNVSGAIPEIRDGAAGVLFLGTASPSGSLTADLRTLATAARSNGNLLVMADDEGGGVQRLAGAVPSLPWPREMSQTMSPDQVRAQATALAQQMRALGVTVDLAPVADVDDRPGPSASNPDGRRSFSGDPAVAARYVVAFMSGLRDGGVLPVVKHFPGLGGSTGNTDVGSAASLPLTSLKTSAFPPFAAAIAAGAPAVMVANATVPGLTAQPASLSPSAVSGVLRTSLGFSGLVVTDSLSAGAISAVTPSLPAAAASSIAAGADVVLFGSTLTANELALLQPGNVQQTFDDIVTAVVSAVQSGRISQVALNAAVVRVLNARHVNPCG
jgi:beta-N-acetylhexosaminidase